MTPPFARRRTPRVTLGTLATAVLATAGLVGALAVDASPASADSADSADPAPMRQPPGQQKVVLGSADHLAPYARGYGRVRPKRVDNGGSPSGVAQHLTWHTWGAKRSKADGRTFLYKPGGGYYQRRGRIQLRAQGLRTCDDGTHGYTTLYFRLAKRPGEPVRGAWRPWASDDGDICD